jgi:hypothetical protein
MIRVMKDAVTACAGRAALLAVVLASATRKRPPLVARHARLLGLLIAVCLAAVVLPASIALASQDTITVNATLDAGLGENPNYCEEGEGAGSNVCPLRAAMESAQNVQLVAADEIVVAVPAGHYELTKGTLEIGTSRHDSCRPGGGVEFTCPIRLQGAGPSLTSIEGTHSGSVLAAGRGPVTVAGSTIEGGYYKVGGGIRVEEVPATLHDDVFTDDGAETAGGAVSAYQAELNVSDTAMYRDTAEFANGGAIWAYDSTDTIARSTLSGNTASEGAALAVEGNNSNNETVIVDSTITGNEAEFAGGGIYAGPAVSLTVDDSTIAGNSSMVGSAVALFGKATVTSEGSILSGEQAVACGETSKAFASGANIVFSSAGCAFAGTSPMNVDPLLGVASANGGVGATLPLLRGSPALNAGGASCAASDVEGAAVDERGLARPQGAACDLGAFESGADAAVTLAVNPNPVSIGETATVTANVSNVGSDPLSGVQATVSLPAGSHATVATPGCVEAAATLMCAVGNLAPGSVVALAVTVRAEPLGALQFGAAVQSEQADFNPSNNSATAASLVGAVQVGNASGGGGGGGGGGTGGTGSSPGGGTSAFVGGTALVGRILAISQGKVLLKVSCVAGTPGGCSDALGLYSDSGRLPAVEAGSRHKITHATALATGNVRIPAGATRVVRLSLDTARRRLARTHKSFPARVLLSLHESTSVTVTHSYAVKVR